MQLSAKWILLTALLAALIACSRSQPSETGSGPEEEPRTILAVFAHPDDEMTVGPALSKWARDGHRVYLAVATDGRFGVSEHAGIPAGDSLATVRTGEARCAADRLGIEPPRLIGLEDGFAHKQAELSDVLADFQRLHEAVRGLFGELNPDVVITWNPGGGYGHPDHRMVSNIVTEVYQIGSESEGGSWPAELLYTAMPNNRFASVPNATQPAVQWFINNWNVVSPEQIGFEVPYSEEDMRDARASLGCHESQFTAQDMEEISELVDHVYNGTVTFRPWSGNGSRTMELLD